VSERIQEALDIMMILEYIIYILVSKRFFKFVHRLRELHTLKGHVESVVKLKGLDIDTMQQHYTV